MSEDLRKVVIAKSLGAKTKTDGGIDEVKQETEHMSAIDKAMDTARKLAGTDILAESVKERDKKMEKMQDDHDKTKDELQKTQLKLIEEQLGGKIDKLSDSIKGGASTKSIGDQITDIKKAATELGLGGGKVSEFKEMADLIKGLNPQKSIVEQIKEANELSAMLHPAKEKETLVEGMPPAIAVELKKLDSDLKIRLEQMADARQERDQNFQITLKKWDEERDIRRQEVDGKILVERERNQIFSGALKTIGESIGKGLKDAGTTSPGGVSQGTQSIAQHYRVNINKGEDLSEFECPGCHSKVGIGPTTALAECINCHSQFEIVRAPAVTSTETSQPAKEEE
jgi:hypothetical protein